MWLEHPPKFTKILVSAHCYTFSDQSGYMFRVQRLISYIFPLMPLRRDLWGRSVYSNTYFDNNIHVIKDSIPFIDWVFVCRNSVAGPWYYMTIWLFSEFQPRNVASLLWHSRSSQSACEMTFPSTKFVITFCVGSYEITYPTFHKIFIQCSTPPLPAPPRPAVRWSLIFLRLYVPFNLFFCLIDPSHFYTHAPVGAPFGDPYYSQGLWWVW